MLELRYRMRVKPPHPHPYAAFFRRAPRGTIHGTDLRFDGDVTHARLIATTEEGDLAAFEEDILANPFPTATRWEATARADNLVQIQASWREPVFPHLGIASPMRDAHDLLGPEAVVSFVLTADVVIHRNLVPESAVLEPLWFRLRDQTLRFTDLTGLPLETHLERLGPWIPEGRLGETEARALVLAAFQMGYWDSPPRTNLTDIAHATGVPAEVVLGHLKEAEAAILERARRGSRAT